MPHARPSYRWPVAALLLAAACGRAPAQAPATPAPDAPTGVLTRVAGQTIVTRTPAPGESAQALAAFTPDLPAVEEGGACDSFQPTPLLGMRQVSARYPDREGARSMVGVTVDSAGRMLRYFEQRGVLQARLEPGDTTASGRPDIRAAFARAGRSTEIHLDFGTGMAHLANTGGGKPDERVVARVEEVADLDRLGRPGDRARAVLARCGDVGRASARALSDSLPYDFAVAVLTSSSPEAVQLDVGRPARAFPVEALPPGSELIGSMTYLARSTTAALVPGRPRETLAAFRARLGENGWAPPPAPAGPRPRGFASSTSAARTPSSFCRGDDHLVPSTTSWPDGRTLLRIAITSEATSTCRPRPPAEARVVTRLDDSMIPTLEPPPGARVSGTGTSGGSDGWTVAARIDAGPSGDRLLAHYGGEMRRAGWEQVGGTGDGPVGALLHRRRLDDGTTWHSILTVAERPGEPGRATALLVLQRE